MDDTLKLWRMLLDPSTTADDCQSSLLRLPGTESFSFDADPTAMSADLDALEHGASLLLDVGSPTAKAMGRAAPVGVRVVSKSEFCLGIFNAKEVRARRDPVVRVCGLPLKGRDMCASTAHTASKLGFEETRLLIETPSVSKATTASFFSKPYLVVASLPSSLDTDKLCGMNAPVGIWRTFFDNTPKAIAILYPKAAATPVTTNVAPKSEVVAQAALKIDPFAELSSVPEKKEDSPSSYLLVDETASLKEEKTILKPPPKPSQSAEKTLSKPTDEDLLGYALDPTLVSSTAELGRKFGLRDSSPDVGYDSEEDPNDLDSYGNDVFNDPPSNVPRGMSLQSSKGSRQGPPTGSQSSQSSNREIQFDFQGADNSDSVTALLLKQVLQSQQGLEARVLSLEGERSALIKRAGQAKNLAQQAFRSAAAQSMANTELKRKYLHDVAKLREEWMKVQSTS